MYPHFIEVHDIANGSEELVNVDCIEGIFIEMLSEDLYCTHIDVIDGDCYQVRETYDELKAMLQKAGTQIDTGDPRLENTPLSWDALTRVDMIGEPVWNSNSRKWMLLIDVASDRTWITLVNTAGGTEQWIEHDAQRFPLYRMRGKEHLGKACDDCLYDCHIDDNCPFKDYE